MVPIRHVATAVLDGPAAHAIVMYSRRQKARLIVMTTYGSSASRDLPLGRVADKVVRMAGLPVLLIRPDAPRANRVAVDWRCDQIVVPLDGSELAQTVLEHVTTLAVGLGARVTLVSVVSPRNKSEPECPSVALGFSVQANKAGIRAAEMHLSLVAQHLRNEGLLVATRVVYGNWPPAEAIRVVARDLDADLIAIATRGRRGAKRLAFGSVAGSLVRSATAPVLVLRPIDRSSERPYSVSSERNQTNHCADLVN
jgi:nucleotide-binding universal stress UspA family protein